jgi:hypothetical protein
VNLIIIYAITPPDEIPSIAVVWTLSVSIFFGLSPSTRSTNHFLPTIFFSLMEPPPLNPSTYSKRGAPYRITRKARVANKPYTHPKK